jgi:hypothetical protein
MKYLVYTIFILLVCLQFGCQPNNIESRIAKKVDSCDNACEISISDLTSFDWDTAFFFTHPVSLETINKKTGHTYTDYEEFTRPFIFTYRNRIVYHENNPSNTEGLINGQIIFRDILDTSVCEVFTYGHDFVRGVRKEDGNKRYYELTETPAAQKLGEGVRTNHKGKAFEAEEK